LLIDFDWHKFPDSFTITSQSFEKEYGYNASAPIILTFYISNNSEKSISVNYIGISRLIRGSQVSFSGFWEDKLYKNDIETKLSIIIYTIS
jgi:hypothetical protein